ncbi:hypothetical protein KFZ56_04885 [Virgibacillus sp. NKC19-3]|uniref:hypothetical protein n=1 Tax=Virgibacillus saliphilus TaxID=2831674 RepID=UPI001C9B8544|nr:hypothetical protein [Virgibacillus sp. NKC19-3]MBY7142425.1 hypothetical protein [Virgibacillus sp. NKC19-3]
MKKTMFVVLFACLLVVSACGSNDDNNTQTEDPDETQETAGEANGENDDENGEEDESTEELYHEVGETFEMTAYYADAEAEITVHDIWTEPGDDHEAFIEEKVSSPEDDANVTFVDYTVKNMSDTQIGLGDLLPTYTAANTEIDVTYPENDNFTDYLESFNHQLEPEEELDLVGAVASREEDQYTSALLWNLTQDIPEIIFHTPQSERKDKIGVYDLGEAIYPVDHGDNGYLEVTINDITIEEEAEGLNPSMDDSSFLVLNTEFENTLNEEIEITKGVPTPMIDDEEITHSIDFSLDGNWIDVHQSADANVESGETLTGDIYLEISNNEIENVQLYYANPALLMFPDYAMKLDYNL